MLAADGVQKAAVTNMMHLMNSELQPNVWKALASFLQLCLREGLPDEESGDAMDDDGRNAGGGKGKGSEKGGKEAFAAGGVSRLAKSPLVQLATLLLRTGGGTDAFAFTGDGAPPSSGASADGGAKSLERAEAGLVARCKQMVVAMRGMEPALTDWA